MEKILSEATRVARLAGKRIKELRENSGYKEYLKNGHELVTTADLISEDIIKTELSKAFPEHKFISEESDTENSFMIKEPTWIIDPIDGTVGYANDHYQVAISIAFAVNNEVEVGVVHNPFLNETFYAVKGKGAFLNNHSIKFKPVKELKQCVIGTGFPHNKDNVDYIIKTLKSILPKIRDIRRIGSPALDICWVACGRLQGFYEEKLFPWDVAAAKLIATEADAIVGHYGLESNTELSSCLNGYKVIVSSPDVFQELKTILTSVK
ncbi:inositol monophosphatase [Clostridium sp. YIM B02515]|uniref:Inositol-1-monophosphatase n=1 Tax=Clostridium rhizosphaerae TaxID=2803861 RepID=A0ABS1TIC6_9CLOT|nr:inositol monophosphatase family protein [Clostridium rhizosphaerae]MBL4938542.1 inositol monophosphatase [Clostridium rhizosphaerae]